MLIVRLPHAVNGLEVVKPANRPTPGVRPERRPGSVVDIREDFERYWIAIEVIDDSWTAPWASPGSGTDAELNEALRAFLDRVHRIVESDRSSRHSSPLPLSAPTAPPRPASAAAPSGQTVAMPNIATSEAVDRARLLDFLRPRHRVILTTTRRDGSPQSSPVTAGIDEDGRVVVSSYPERAKTANARRDPAGSALFLSDDWNGPWVQVRGRLDVVDLPEALEPLVAYFRGISGEHPDWDEYRAAMVTQGKCVLRLSIDSWSPIATGGFPARLARD